MREYPLDQPRLIDARETGVPKPKDGRPVHEALRPDFVWPAGAPA